MSSEYEERVITHYMAKHSGRYIYLALESLGFYREFYRIGTGNIPAVMASINTRFLHVVLRRVEDPSNGIHNKVHFATSTARSIVTLQDGEHYSRRLAAVCPAILIGLSIFNPAVDDPVVTTIIYPFNFTSLRAIALGTARIVEGIIEAEQGLQDEGKD